jgi:cobalt/nickel transport system ATP-binding protein
MPPLLEIRNLSFSHGDGIRALSGVSFDLSHGENLAILGPNGSGKTTLLLHLNGVLQGSGEIRVGGLTVSDKNLPEVRRRVGLVFQNSDEQLFMPTVLQDVMFGPLNLGWNIELARDRSVRALTDMGITPTLFDRPPFHLSAGEKRRVALAGVLVMKPEILLLDEPTTSLDPPGQRALVELLRFIPQPKIVATHDAGFASKLSDRAIFLEGGRVACDGPIQLILSKFNWGV